MKKPSALILVFLLILIASSAIADAADEAPIADALRQAGIAQPVQLSQWGDTAA